MHSALSSLPCFDLQRKNLDSTFKKLRLMAEPIRRLSASSLESEANGPSAFSVEGYRGHWCPSFVFNVLAWLISIRKVRRYQTLL
jgi:hypothetical protein